MFCTYCGKEIDNSAEFCTYCGRPTSEPNSVSVEAAAQPMGEALFGGVFEDKTFFTATVFYTIATALSFLANILLGEIMPPVLNIFVIFALFKINSLYNSGAPLLSFASPIKILRVIVNIIRIVCWVVAGILGVCGAILTFSGFALRGAADIADFAFALELDAQSQAILEKITEGLGIGLGLIIGVMGIVFIVIAAALLVLALFMYGSFYKSAKSAENAANTGEILLEKVNATRGWLIASAVIGIISAVFSLGSLAGASGILAIGSEACHIVTYFLFAKLMRKLPTAPLIY